MSVAGIGVGLTVAGTGAAFASGDYTVKSGDTLSEIAAANDTSWQRLAELNGLQNPDLILIGQQLNLSGAATTRSERRSDRAEKKSERRGTKTERPERRSQRTERSERRSERSSRSESGGSLSGAWAKVAECESGGNPRAVNPSGKYYGLFQFDRQTWRSVGGSGSPSDASASEQLTRAKRLYAQRGSSPWPNCGRYLR